MKNLTRRDLVSLICKEGKLKLNSRDSVLIGEDESGLRVTLHMILMPIYDVDAAENGQQGLNISISQEKVDLATLDINMPGFPGIDILREIKKLRPDIEVIVSTGYATSRNAQEGVS